MHRISLCVSLYCTLLPRLVSLLLLHHFTVHPYHIHFWQIIIVGSFTGPTRQSDELVERINILLFHNFSGRRLIFTSQFDIDNWLLKVAHIRLKPHIQLHRLLTQHLLLWSATTRPSLRHKISLTNITHLLFNILANLLLVDFSLHTTSLQLLHNFITIFQLYFVLVDLSTQNNHLLPYLLILLKQLISLRLKIIQFITQFPDLVLSIFLLYCLIQTNHYLLSLLPHSLNLTFH